MKYLAIVALMASCAPAYAQSNCAETQDVYDIISNRYGEDRYTRGLSDRGYITEVWGNEQTGSWTIIATSADGVSCILDQGKGFSRVQLPGQL